MNTTLPQTETFADRWLGASIPDRDARLRLVRLDETLSEILGAHDYPPAIRHLLAEALAEERPCVLAFAKRDRCVGIQPTRSYFSPFGLQPVCGDTRM